MSDMANNYAIRNMQFGKRQIPQPVLTYAEEQC